MNIKFLHNFFGCLLSILFAFSNISTSAHNNFSSSVSESMDQNSYYWFEDYTGPKYWENTPQDGVIVSFADHKELIPGPNDKIRAIVQFKKQSVAQYKLSLSPALNTRAKQDLIHEYSSELTTNQDMWLESIKEAGVEITEINRHQLLSNNITVFTSPINFKFLRGNEFVKQVSPDYQVKPHLVESIPLIGADQTWQVTSPTGTPLTGIEKIIAVIDSGIDYTHPNLGGCLGSGCKVLGGYDFVNLDNDPFDDFGHGTHVAGIISASGSLKGVAPDARLLAYKVISEEGTGYASDVISAIERAVLDHADVINLSIGGPGNPSDPLSQSVDMATEMGTVVVASAGNRGSNYATIDSPGLAYSAITVGASTKTDYIASFSSRGPVADSNLTAKPDLIAPGQSIYSTVPVSGPLGSASGFRYLSGTSMAAPHVAGAAALLRQYRPSWTPQMIKTALMNLAVKKNYDVFTQGAGRLDLRGLEDMGTLVTSEVIDFGIDDLAMNTWVKEQTVRITNLQLAPREFLLSLPEAMDMGVSITISPHVFSLNAGQTQEILLTLTVENQILPNAPAAPYSYHYNLLLSDGENQENLNFTFIKMPILDMQINDDPWVVVVHNRQDLIKTSSFDYHPIMFLPEGYYDVLIQFLDGKSRVEKENVLVNAMTNLEFNKSDATNRVDIIMNDIHGQKIPFEGLLMDQRMPTALTLKGSDFGLYSLGRSCIGETTCDHLMFSDVSDAYSFEITIPAQSVHTNWDYYRFYHQLSEGISGDLLLENSADELKPVNFHFPKPSVGDSITLIRWIGSKMILTTSDDTYQEIHFPFTEQAYYQAVDPNGVMILEMLGVFDSSSLPISIFPAQFQTPPFFATSNTSLSITSLIDPGVPTLLLNDDNWDLTLSPPHWTGKLGFDQEFAWIDSIIGGGALFCFQNQDFKNPTALPFVLSKDGFALLSGLIKAGQSIPLATSGAYSLSMNLSDYEVGVREGAALVELEFDTTLPDGIPPVIESFVILDDQKPIDILPKDRTSNLVVHYRDDSAIETVRLFYRTGQDWIELPALLSGEMATATLPVLPEYAYIDLKIIIEDEYHNKLTMSLVPGALVVGNYQLVFPIAFN